MLFHRFASQEERRKYGGSAFVEIQFCRLPAAASIQERVAVDRIGHWQNDSLYVDDENTFFREYSPVFDCGTYNDLQCGTVDVYGINYYAPSLTDHLLGKLRRARPKDWEVLAEWLGESKKYNGFYILGL